MLVPLKTCTVVKGAEVTLSNAVTNVVASGREVVLSYMGNVTIDFILPPS